ncbi:MAG: hypothetical protein UR27_C0021G0038 [Candidatus Peregrinibacteria bacterium GW2011_GWA2_33_10]|nr:MAG: hypothetical protein UR27_C0021G0038 [Candidatus Peregrinibacteria bacterium GW2011_GWA2_33_10]KKP40979.1 MAG: hypothetical protein UR30_C0002G0013 [Candidatus Peregrinibacteria bacterium GW2011_GWC2_33_13]
MKPLSQERIGEIFIALETILYATFPILIAHSTKIMPPILFAALGSIIAGIFMFFYILIKKEFKDIFNLRTIKYTLGVTVFIVIIPSIFIFLGSSKTSGINTTILLQSEILFTLIICGIFTDDKVTLKKLIGAIIMVVGTLFILFNKNFSINWGDIMIIIGTLFYPVGNIFAKKALKFSSPSSIVFIRNVIGGIILLLISLQFETINTPINQMITGNLFAFFVNGILISAISKIVWYEGLKRIDISKAILLSIGGYPAISLIFAIIFLKEIPTLQQIMGFAIIIFGVFQIIERKKSLQINPEY